MSIIKKRSQTTEIDLDRFRGNKKKKKWWIIPLILILIAAAWYILPIIRAYNQATTEHQGDGGDVLQQSNQSDAKPINILLIGIGGEGHPGGSLADTIMVASVDPKTKNISLLSLPRDLYVTIPGKGKEKINAAHVSSSTNKGDGPAKLKQVVSSTLGIPIHYFVRIDFDGFKKVVDALGGVKIDVKKAINDQRYPDAKQVGYDPFVISAGTHTMNGTTALKYVRSRESTSDFDRARRQQEVLVAIKDKALSAQVLANPKKVTDIITILGKHILTDFSASEIDQLIALGRQFTSPTVRQFVFDSSEKGLLLSSRNEAGSFILVPRAGANDFSELQTFSQAYVQSPRIAPEKPVIKVIRGSATREMTTKVVNQLEWAGFTVQQAATADSTATTTSLIDASSGEKNESLTYLKNSFKVTPKTATASSTATPTATTTPVSTASPTTTSDPDFTLTVGSDIVKLLNTTTTQSSTDGHDVLQEALASPSTTYAKKEDTAGMTLE